MSWKNVQYENGKYRTSSGGGGGASNFADLDDVSFSNLQNGQVPKYNSTTQKWENANESGGGGTVTDVEVDGVSVVNQQGVAEINTPDADGISYDNQQSSLSATNVQSAIDELAQGGSGHNYSETEQEICVGANLKPVYEITKIVTGSYSKGSENVFTVNVSNVTNLRMTEGYIVYNSSVYIPANIYINSNAYVYVYFVTNANSIEIHINSTEWDYTRLEITLRYQKTTD